uniref:Mitochondrial import inner membrane translocase subunit Tim23-like n=1 Tax=Dermatophagoides pteronyssinus TaxID=6956 RepID=A0A6P6YH87_DERPT|nr:mitochondrial import inner membrane translocase subunit Tim23-like [Dermatophagoides pteronyssinus]
MDPANLFDTHPSSSPSSLSSPSLFANIKPNQIKSPFLNQSSLPDQLAAEYIVPDFGGVGGTSSTIHNRGRFELAFSQIGGAVMLGSGFGGAMGTYRGLKEIAQLKESSSKEFLRIKRTKLLNYITRNGARMANTFGSIALTYSAIGVAAASLNQHQKNDDINTAISAITTGALYGGLISNVPNQSLPNADKWMWKLRTKRAGIGSLIGFIAAATYILLFNSDKYY